MNSIVTMTKSNSVTIFAMTEKGYRSLETVLPRYKSIINCVVSARDDSIRNDFYDNLKELCDSNKIEFVDRKNYRQVITTNYGIAISWKWLINNRNSKLIVLHDSLLPRYRGFNPLVSALINGDTKIGATAFIANREYDRGEIIRSISIDIDYPIKIQEAINKIIYCYRILLSEVLELIITNSNIETMAQDENLATYSLWRDEDDYRIDWSNSSEFIKRFIDATGYPYKGASSLLSGKLVRVLDASVINDVKIENRCPGKVFYIEDGYPIVVCGVGLIKLTEIVEDITGKSVLPFKELKKKFT